MVVDDGGYTLKKRERFRALPVSPSYYL